MKNLIVRIINNDDGEYSGDLRHYFRVMMGAPNVNNPYHNFRHMMHVLCSAYEGGVYEHIPQTEMRILLVAALFHDYGHSGQMGNDALEIERAVAGFQEHVVEKDRGIAGRIEELIRATQWPHMDNTNLPYSAKILRDADFSQSLDSVWWQQIVFGLAAEFGIPVKEHLARQIIFLSELKFQSDWGKKILAPKASDRVEELRDFLEIIG